ncbi:MAG: hypothetical protein OXC99_11430 [Chloroflexi bacterium]|nr:hypothetical protein [Chloroflexota bacterium]
MLRESFAMLHYSERVVTEVLILTAEFDQEGDQWTGECLELGTATCADTFEDVRKELYELVDLHVNGVDKMGGIEDFLSERGIKPLRVADVGQEYAANTYVTVGAPL